MARVKTVFPTRQVAHIWAQRDRVPNGRNAQGNFYFNGATIYSYGSHFPAATLVTNKRGERGALVSNRNYSVTTRRHMSHIRGALTGTFSFIVPEFPIDSGGSLVVSAAMHAANLEYFASEMARAIRDARKARIYAESAVTRAQAAIDTANAYARFFGLRWRLKLPAKFAAEAPELIARANAKRAVCDAERDARHQARRAQREADNRARHAERLAQWLAGESVYISLTDEYGGAYLRVRGDKVETSRGAEVTVSEAREALAFILANTPSTLPLNFAAVGMSTSQVRIGAFELREIRPDGSVQIGCHFIHATQLEKVRAILAEDRP